MKAFTPRKALFRSWLTKIEIGNVLVAISTIGLMAIGVLPLSLPIMLVFAAVLVVLGAFGKYIDELEDDRERLILYETHLKSLFRGDGGESASSSDTSTPSNQRVQLPSSEDKDR